MPPAYEWSKWRWKGKNSVTKRKIFIFQVRDNTKLFTFLFWIFLSLKSNVILGSKGMFLRVVWSLKQIWVNENTMMFPHTSFSMPGNSVSASLLQVVKSFKTIYSICSSSTNYISQPGFTLTLRASHAVALFISNPADSPWNSNKRCQTETRLCLAPEQVHSIHVCSWF